MFSVVVNIIPLASFTKISEAILLAEIFITFVMKIS